MAGGIKTSAGSYTHYFVATGATTHVSFVNTSYSVDVTIDNISVREINPLSVSIQMDGRMTYADENLGPILGQPYTGAVIPFVWNAEGTTSENYLSAAHSTFSTLSGKFYAIQEASNVGDFVGSAAGTYSPGVLVPFNISSRHGSTFINGAVDGVALTANTTPTALPDLSGTDLEIAKDFMGTIGTFRQFAGDIGDAGLVTATNPSTEPTLSLTFDGTEGSFYNLSWSE